MWRPRRRFWIIPAAFLALFLIPFAAWGLWVATGHSAPAGPGGGAPFVPWGLFWFPFGFLFFLFIVFFLVRAAFWWGGGWGHGYGYYGRRWHDYPMSARDIAAARYARGELTSEQYRQIVRDLSETAPRPT